MQSIKEAYLNKKPKGNNPEATREEIKLDADSEDSDELEAKVKSSSKWASIYGESQAQVASQIANKVQSLSGEGRRDKK